MSSGLINWCMQSWQFFARDSLNHQRWVMRHSNRPRRQEELNVIVALLDESALIVRTSSRHSWAYHFSHSRIDSHSESTSGNLHPFPRHKSPAPGPWGQRLTSRTHPQKSVHGRMQCWVYSCVAVYWECSSYRGCKHVCHVGCTRVFPLSLCCLTLWFMYKNVTQYYLCTHSYAYGVCVFIGI